MEKIRTEGLSPSAKGILFAMGSQLLFSMSVLATKVTLANHSLLSLLSWRFTIGALALTILGCFGVFRIRLDGKILRTLLPMALFQPVLYFIGETIGIRMTTASESGTIIACVPIVTLLFSAFFLKKAPTWKQTAGVVLSVLGVVVLVLVKGAEASLQPLGYMALFLAVGSAAAFTILSDRISEYSSLEKTYVMALFGAIVFDGMALVQCGINGTIGTWLLLPFTNLSFLATVLYLGVGCSVVAFFCMNKAIQHIGAMRTSSFAGMNTVLTILSGAVFLGEQLGVIQILGTIMVIVGVYVTNATGNVPADCAAERKERGDGTEVLQDGE